MQQSKKNTISCELDRGVLVVTNSEGPSGCPIRYSLDFGNLALGGEVSATGSTVIDGLVTLASGTVLRKYFADLHQAVVDFRKTSMRVGTNAPKYLLRAVKAKSQGLDAQGLRKGEPAESHYYINLPDAGDGDPMVLCREHTYPVVEPVQFSTLEEASEWVEDNASLYPDAYVSQHVDRYSTGGKANMNSARRLLKGHPQQATLSVSSLEALESHAEETLTKVVEETIEISESALDDILALVVTVDGGDAIVKKLRKEYLDGSNQ